MPFMLCAVVGVCLLLLLLFVLRWLAVTAVIDVIATCAILGNPTGATPGATRPFSAGSPDSPIPLLSQPSRPLRRPPPRKVRPTVGECGRRGPRRAFSNHRAIARPPRNVWQEAREHTRHCGQRTHGRPAAHLDGCIRAQSIAVPVLPDDHRGRTAAQRPNHL